MWRRRDRVTDLICSFNRADFRVDAAVVNEINACVDAALPDAQKPAVSAWLTANASIAEGAERTTTFGRYHILIYQPEDGFRVEVAAHP